MEGRSLPMPRLPVRTLLALLLAGVVLGTAAPPAAADLITYNLDQSNTLPDGLVYGTVTVEALQNLGEVKITYTANPALYSATRQNFGFNTIGFNTDLSLQSSQFTLPSGWKLYSNGNLNMFGVFSWKLTTTKQEAPVVTLLIDGLGNNATLDHFTLDSKGGEPVYFAGHIINFSLNGCNTTTSQW